MTRIATAAACALFALLSSATAQEDADAGDMAEVKACLAIADARRDAALAQEADAPEARTGAGPDAYFAASAAARALGAGYARENCIGIVAEPCADAQGYSLMAEDSCIGAETAVWDSLLNASYRKELGLPPPEPDSEETPEEEAAKPHAAEPAPDCMPIACEASTNGNLRQTQRAFAAWRNAMCLRNYISSGGGRENQIAISWCHMNLTAQQFFWVEYGEGFER